MKLLLFILSLLYFSPYVSIANDNSKTLATKVELLLKTNIKYIDKKNDIEKVPYSIMFDVYIINKTKNNVIIPPLDNNLIFFLNYKSTENDDYISRKVPNLYFGASSSEKELLKANSYIKMEFEYRIKEHEFKRCIINDKNNIAQGWCYYMGLIKSNIVNIPIISYAQKEETLNKKNALHKTEEIQTEKFPFPDKKNNPVIVKLKANGDVFINKEIIEINNISNKLQKNNTIVFFDKDAPQKDVIAVLEQIAKSNVSPIFKFEIEQLIRAEPEKEK